MKKILIICSIFTFFVLFPFNVFAEIPEDYSKNIELFGIEELEKSIDENTEKFLKENNINISDFNFTNNLDTENIFNHIFSIFKTGIKSESQLFCTLLGIIFITASIGSIDINDNNKKTLTIVSAISIALLVSNDIWNCIESGVQIVKSANIFMTAFIPIFAGATFLSGGTISSVSTSAILMLSTQFVSFVFSYFVLPMLGVYLAITLCSSISAFNYLSNTTESIKKILVFVLSFVSTIFVGILSIKTNINASADSLGLKTAKFIVGTFIPIAGNSLAEAASAVYSSLSFIRSSLGVYAIIILAVMVVPIIVEILLTKAMLSLSSIISNMFNLDAINTLIKSISDVLSVLLTIILFTFGLFVISLSVVITAGKIK